MTEFQGEEKFPKGVLKFKRPSRRRRGLGFPRDIGKRERSFLIVFKIAGGEAESSETAGCSTAGRIRAGGWRSFRAAESVEIAPIPRIDPDWRNRLRWRVARGVFMRNSLSPNYYVFLK